MERRQHLREHLPGVGRPPELGFNRARPIGQLRRKRRRPEIDADAEDDVTARPPAPDEASARIPAILRRARNPAPPTATMSFGHLIWTGSAVAARIPSATATPPASVIHGASEARRTIVDM